MEHTGAYWNILQHTATYCSILEHTGLVTRVTVGHSLLVLLSVNLSQTGRKFVPCFGKSESVRMFRLPGRGRRPALDKVM
jgi:hypothetical protein